MHVHFNTCRKNTCIAQRHSIIKGEGKEEVFGRVQVSSGVDEPQDKRFYTEVG